MISPAADVKQTSIRRSLFVGRGPELGALRAALAHAISGTDHLLMLAGDAGMGKTRLCQELADEAARCGALVLWGRCLEEPGAPPYWPWIQALRSFLATCDDAMLRATLADDADAIAGIMPELAKRLPDLAQDPVADSDHARFHLFDALTQFWRRLAANDTLLLILDNLHWADPTSLRLLGFLASELGQGHLLLLGTYREDEVSRQHPLSETLAELTRSANFQRLRLGGLSREETEQFVTAVRAGTPAPELAKAIHERTEGNPLYLVETLRFLLQEWSRRGEPRENAAAALETIPPGIREMLGKRLNRLSAPCSRVLSIAACIGRAFDIELLMHLVPETTQDALLAALEEALAAHVIETPAGETSRFQFSHVLIRETLYDEMLPARRVGVHRGIAELIEATAGEHVESRLPQLAYHYSASLPGGDARKALDYTRRAAQRAARLLAHEEALRLYQRALELQQRCFPQDRECRCALLLGLGAAQNSAGASEAGWETFRQGAALARELGSPAALAQAALGFETTSWRLGRPGEQAATLLTEALSAVQEQKDKRLRVELLASLCRAYAFSDRAAEAMQAHRQAVALARPLGDPSALFRALVAFLAARFPGPQQLDERLAAAREARALAEQYRQEAWAVTELYGWYFADLMEKGDLESAKTVVASHVQVAEAMRQPFLMAVGLSSQTLLAIHEGRFAEAEALAQETLKVGKRFSPANAAGAYGMQMFSIRREQGRLGEVLPVLRHFVATEASDTWRPGLALLYAELDMREEARREFESLAADDFAAIPRSALWPTSMAFMAEVCAYLDDAARAATLYRLLQPYAGRNIVTGNNAPCFGAADRLLGMLAASAGQSDSAQRHFETALAMNRHTGGLPWLAHSEYCYAALFARKHGTGTERAALALLESALATGRELGMATLERRCQKLKEKIEGRLVYPDGLSKREVDVLRFIAAGKNNREIGELLFISPNTVANHIRSILAKTGTANRTEAAVYVIRHRLTEG